MIELLVVIAIISILASILMPAFATAREKGRQTACLSNMKQLGYAFMIYAQDYDEGFPGAGGGRNQVAPCAPVPTDGYSWVKAQRITNETSQCPRDLLPVPNGALYTYVKNERVYTCNSDQFADTKTLSYSMNMRLDGQGLPQVQTPSDCILLVDESRTLNDGFFALPDPGSVPAGTPDWFLETDRPATQHNGGANFLFVDGHGKWRRPTQLKPSHFDYSGNGG